MSPAFVRILLLLTGLGPFVACDESSTLVLDPNPATRIVIESSRCPQTSVRRCDTCQLDFQAFDKNGREARFPTVLWSSTDPAIASVDDVGRVAGWVVGEVTIEARVQETGASDEVEMQVLQAARPVSCSPPGLLAN
ncbi:MAG TPA: Ig-like domain-containing protein [Gemmatimonadota bacterium]|nr:Ig-like domain-containing protein [Gemmatimonadota bacterium]